MEKILANPLSNFYHVTTIENWYKIKGSGFNTADSRIFVSRVGELPILFAIAFEQLPEVYNSKGLVILKFPQIKNNFLTTEIKKDNQALVEWTQIYQNVICRSNIPIENIELLLEINWGEGAYRDYIIGQLTEIAQQGEKKYANHNIKRWAMATVYTPD